jgi:uncharacterized protein (DUF433 family)
MHLFSTNGSSPAKSNLNGKPVAKDPIFGKPLAKDSFLSSMKKHQPLSTSHFHDFEDENSEAYHEFARSFKSELEPDGFIEHFFADRVVMTAWRLQRAVWEVGTDPTMDDPTLERYEARAEQAMLKAFSYFQKLRTQRAKRASLKAANDSKAASQPRLKIGKGEAEAAQQSAGSTTSSSSKTGSGKSETKSAAERAQWRERLSFDTKVSADSPVVKATQITVKHVVTLVVDGWTWADIVRVHPQLTEEDIRACLWYAVEEENASLHLK